MALAKNEIIKLSIENISNDANGVGHYNGIAVFVPFTAVGDILQCKIVKVCKSYAFGIIDKILTYGDGRAKNSCNNFGQCGGCNLRHLTYKTELETKQQFVADAIKRIGKIETPILPILPSVQEIRYRNKVQYPVALSPDGKVYTGFYAGRSHRIVQCSDCLLQPVHLNDILKAVCEFLQKEYISIYNEATGKGLVRHIYLRDGVHSGEVMLCLVINGKSLPHANDFVDYMVSRFGEIKTIVLNINQKQTNVITGPDCVTLYGAGYINDTLCDVPIQLNPLSFFQVNTLGAEQLYKVAQKFADVTTNDILLDLYCGMGTIGLSMAKSCKQLIGVEIIPQAIQAAKISAEKMQLNNTSFMCADAGEAAQQLLDTGLKPSIIILDPPRKGCDQNALNAVIKMQPQKIVMVSCNPATAARDLSFLAQNDYCVQAIQPVDMFPRTKHVETCVLLSHKNPQTSPPSL